jgi:phage terminase Nu1 subunit (DNA packaging protein)
MSKFSVPEINLICIFAAQTKAKTIENIMDSIPDFTERELVELAEEVIIKLDKITEDEFTEHEFSEQFSDESDEYAYAE